MSTTAKNTQAFELLATKLVELHNEHGDLSTLTTTAKGDFTAAINEVKALADAAATGGLAINDTTASTGDVYSSQKTEDRLAEILADASADTVAQINAALESEDLSDLAAEVDAVTTLAAANAALIVTAQADIVQLQTDLGDESTYDPLAAINAILNF